MKARIRSVTLMVMTAALAIFASCGTMKDQSTVSQSNSSQYVAETSASTEETSGKATQQYYAGLSVMNKALGWEIQSVPESEAVVTVTAQSLRDLPEGAAFRSASGQASVELRRTDDRITAIGHCDSLSRLCSYYAELNILQEEMLDSLEEVLDRTKAHERKLAMELAEAQSSVQMREVKPPNRQWLWCMLGAVPGLIAGFWLGQRYKP